MGAGTGLLALAAAPLARQAWAVDISRLMCDYLHTKAASGGLGNISVAVASATSLPLVDACADVVLSNYCLHHLRHPDKLRALAEARRVLRPGGRLVLADMMFRVGGLDDRDRRIVASKVRAMASHGAPGLARLAKHAARTALGQGEQPVSIDWWSDALWRSGFDGVVTEVFAHEGGLAAARVPSVPARR